MSFKEKYQRLRARTIAICASLAPEDYVVQPVVDVSPPKWHLGHTTWFFETFVLTPHQQDYAVFDPDYNYVFNSYYETVGARVVRTDRGNLSRPTVEEVFRYRAYVDAAMIAFLSDETAIDASLRAIIELGLNHEEQHQELLITDIKYILGNNPLLPAYACTYEKPEVPDIVEQAWLDIPEGVYEIGAKGDQFCFDNELNRHKVYAQAFAIQSGPVTNEQFIAFIEDGGYQDFRHWHSDGWAWVQQHQVAAPMYWQQIEGAWYHYTPEGLTLVPLKQPVCHISYYEAWAFAAWAGCRLPTEAEWELASDRFPWGARWEWTESAYLPYPGFVKAEGAIGEYNGKFMVNQMVLRGASEATTPGHSRNTYRNFFQPGLRWQFTGLRLAR
ncbi:ergothioneine biosynthesis protein EgtB [Taibaiella koreensis]|uniref:ergothioneine biosynthesis protein EgtB n=1 Tax=Taibaiella koreensis TaxID=1268548 RepID=UPI000E59B741|nr:ergothioneine biosynthesis protein EgtB [Taibaiella koreensis]